MIEYDKDIMTQNNLYLQQRYKELKLALPKAKVLSYPKSILLLDENHKWGLSPVHYIKKVYEHAIFFLEKKFIDQGVKMQEEFTKSLTLDAHEKVVGVVVPIYNSAKYLEKCLDSIINQTYKKIEIILVNDGSTDELSLKIAKEYTKKDSRITLIDKKNGAQGSARNAGIEYFEKLYQCVYYNEEEDLLCFKITNENPLGIKALYKAKSYCASIDNELLLHPLKIDYLIFLDSDDFWELDCVEECVKNIQDADILWFDFYFLYDGIKDKSMKTHLENYAFTQSGFISSDEWMQRNWETNIRSFPFAWSGMINFNFLKSIGLKFLNETTAEDLHFGVLLFAQASKIYILNEKLYHYRIRPRSTCVYDEKISKENLPPYLYELYEMFDQNAELTKEYHKATNHIKIAQAILEWIKEHEEEEVAQKVKRIFLPTYCNRSQAILKFKDDPLKFEEKFYTLKPFIERPRPYGAAKRIKNQLSYRIGLAIIENSKSLKGYLVLPFVIFHIFKENKFESRVNKVISKNYPQISLQPLENYLDYKDALALKEHLSYRLGQAFLRACKKWYKGEIFILPFKMKRIYRDYKKNRRDKNE